MIDQIHAKLNEIYEQRKGYKWDGYTAPECRPRVQSDQVLALMEVLVEKIEQMESKLAWLDRHTRKNY